MTVIIFVIVLAVLIFVHELGHFLFAKLNGIRVDEFKLGFGPRIVYWSWGETEYGVNIIPFGGFVKIHGENPDEESIDGPDKSRSFVNKNRFRQITVLVAGVLFNFLFAWILYVGVLSSGVTATTDGFEQYAHDFKNERIMITYVEPGSPAEKSGL
ncbi:MAG: site-2 protease family protein [Patescibacteria group bacterium]|nr:site-2 protease family protein [Patescibacteria group bacterium]